MAIKNSNIDHCKTSKIYPVWNFWFENMPSGNPALQEGYNWSWPSITWVSWGEQTDNLAKQTKKDNDGEALNLVFGGRFF
jgi:hypothetical protein